MNLKQNKKINNSSVVRESRKKKQINELTSRHDLSGTLLTKWLLYSLHIPR